MVLLNIVHYAIRPLQRARTFQTINLSAIRTYARWTSRRPVAIVNEDKLYETDDTTQSFVPREKKAPSRKRKNAKLSKEFAKEKQKTKQKAAEKVEKTQFFKVEESVKIVTGLMTQLRNRKKREKNNEVVLEGHRLIKDALKTGLTPTAIIFNDLSVIKELKLPKGVTLYKVPYKTIQLWSSLTTSPGIIGIFKTPDIQNNVVPSNAIPLTIICDNIREPGNLGSIMRAVAGVGCEKLILTKGCVDLWDPKVLRSAAGTHFQLPIHSFPTWDEIPSLVDEDCNVFLADSNFGDQFLSNYSPEVLQSSLDIFDLDPKELKSKLILNNENEENKSETTIPTNKKVMQKLLLNLPIMPYYSLDYTRRESVIILSGETEGLSLDSYKFLSERKSIRINIPLAKGVDSLNVGVALGIVAFEIKRQFLKRHSQL